MRKLTMTGGPKRVYVPLPDDYFDMTDAEQDAVCLEMAQALIAGLGVPHRLDGAVHDENPDDKRS
jgi:hypothetical protein